MNIPFADKLKKKEFCLRMKAFTNKPFHSNCGAVIFQQEVNGYVHFPLVLMLENNQINIVMSQFF